MLYLLDANVLMTAHDAYYPIERVPQFWKWIIDNAENGRIKIPYEILGELEAGNKESELFKWVRENKKNLLLDEDVDILLVNKVIEQGYANDLTDDEIHKLGRDPFLIAYALAARPDRCVVTLEGVQSNAKPKNRKIPLVCAMLKIPCINTFALIRELDFKIPANS